MHQYAFNESAGFAELDGHFEQKHQYDRNQVSINVGTRCSKRGYLWVRWVLTYMQWHGAGDLRSWSKEKEATLGTIQWYNIGHLAKSSKNLYAHIIWCIVNYSIVKLKIKHTLILGSSKNERRLHLHWATRVALVRHVQCTMRYASVHYKPRASMRRAESLMCRR